MLLAIQDEAWRFGRYYKNVFRRININPNRVRFGFRSSFAAAGFVGRRPRWIRYMSRPQRRGPSYIRIRIRLLRRKCEIGVKWRVVRKLLCRVGGQVKNTVDCQREVDSKKCVVER